MNIYLTKLFYRLLSFILLLIIVLGAALYFMLTSTTGAKLVLAYAGSYLQKNFATELHYDQVTGDLLSGLDFDNLRVLHPQINLEASSFSSTWNLLALLNRQLNLDNLHISGLDVALISPEANNDNLVEGDSTDLKSQIDAIFDLPLALNLLDLDLSTAQISIAEQDYQIEKLSGGLTLDSSALSLNTITFAGYGMDINGSAALQADSLLLDGNLDWRLANTLAIETLGDTLSGSIFFSGDISNIEITHTLSQPTMINSEGILSTGLLDATGLNFSFEHNFTELLGFLPQQNFLSSISGNLLTHGSADLVFVDAAIQLIPEQLSPIALVLSGEYQNQSLIFETISANSDEFSIQAIANMALQPFNFQFEWGLSNLVLDQYLQAISLEDVSAGGQLVINDAGEAELALSFLTARLNDYPFQASGLLEYANNALNSINIDLNAGANSINLTGSLDEQIDLYWQIDAPDLAVWLPGLSGRISGAGQASGDLDNPQLSGDLQADALLYESADSHYELQRLRANIATNREAYRINLSLQDFNFPFNETSYRFTDGDISLNGTLAEHQGMLSLNADALALQFMLDGSYLDEVWRASISNASIDSAYGLWTLQEQLDLTLSSSVLNVSQHCWNYRQTRFCNGLNLDNDIFDISVSLDEFPLAYMNTENIITLVNQPELNRQFESKPPGLVTQQQAFAFALPDNTFIDGFLNAQLQAQGNINSLSEADFLLQLEPRNLSLNLYLPQDDERQSVQPEIRTFRLDHRSLQLSQSMGLWQANADLSVYHQEANGVDIQGDINALVNMDLNENLSGSVEFDFSSLNWLETLLPDIRNTQGQLNGLLDIEGSIAEPRILTNLSILGGSFELPEYGIAPEQVEIDIVSDDQQNIQILASAVSGTGELIFTGNANALFTADRTFSLSLQGENFSLINNIGTQLSISPDIELSYHNNAVDIQGSVTVPELGLDIRENQTVLINQGTEISRDARVISAPPEQEYLLANNPAQQQLQEISVTANLDLALGENVHFQGLGLDLWLDGELQIQQDPGRPLLAYGDISIREGVYAIYGQRLDISNGKLIFFGNPANPALDIRAYRANTSIQAGVQINGTLRNMQSQLFSPPSLPDSEILSILITGKSFANTDDEDQSNLLGAITSLGINRGQGGLANTIRSELGLDSLALNSQNDLTQSSLGLGKYLTPNIFMHYEIGLFEKQSILSLDYILSERLKLEVESGVSQSIDMTYTIEK